MTSTSAPHMPAPAAYSSDARNTMIFQNLNALEVVTRIFADYPQAQWDARVTQLLPRRALCTQYRDTDFEFVCRLLSEEGLSFYFEYGDKGKDSARLVINDRDYQWPDGGVLVFSREDTPQPDDGIRRLGAQCEITNDAASTCAWNAEQLLGLSGTAHSTLGYAIACAGSKRSAYQGLGFSQATQGWGQIRAAEGMLLSASLQTGANASQMQMSDALDQLYGAMNTAERLSQAAQQSQAGIMDAHAAQQALGDELNPRKGAHYPAWINGQRTTQLDSEQAVERFSAPHRVLEAPDHLTVATPASSNVFAGQQLQVTSQQDLHLSAGHTIAGVSGGNLHWYAAKGGAKVTPFEQLPRR